MLFHAWRFAGVSSILVRDFVAGLVGKAVVTKALYYLNVNTCEFDPSSRTPNTARPLKATLHRCSKEIGSIEVCALKQQQNEL